MGFKFMYSQINMTRIQILNSHLRSEYFQISFIGRLISNYCKQCKAGVQIYSLIKMHQKGLQ